jgi:fructokinase
MCEGEGGAKLLGRSGLYGGVEAGGTKFVCAVGDESATIHASTRIRTTSPMETLAQVIAFFRTYAVHSIGLATFGPIDLDPVSPTYGRILSTPKLLWQGYPIVERLQTALGVPVVLDTDVNAATMAEATYGAGRNCDPLVYLTIGTGIGGGVFIHGRLLHGLMHPEMGHILLARTPGDTLPGSCHSHQDCFEGLASGSAIRFRFGDPETLAEDHDAWVLEAYYIGQALASLSLVLSPRKIIVGGGVMAQQHLMARIRRECRQILNGYLPRLGSVISFDEYIVPPGLGNNSGIIGALCMAREYSPAVRTAPLPNK